MKKLLSLLLMLGVVVMVPMFLTGCGDDDDDVAGTYYVGAVDDVWTNYKVEVYKWDSTDARWKKIGEKTFNNVTSVENAPVSVRESIADDDFVKFVVYELDKGVPQADYALRAILKGSEIENNTVVTNLFTEMVVAYMDGNTPTDSLYANAKDFVKKVYQVAMNNATLGDDVLKGKIVSTTDFMADAHQFVGKIKPNVNVDEDRVLLLRELVYKAQGKENADVWSGGNPDGDILAVMKNYYNIQSGGENAVPVIALRNNGNTNMPVVAYLSDGTGAGTHTAGYDTKYDNDDAAKDDSILDLSYDASNRILKNADVDKIGVAGGDVDSLTQAVFGNGKMKIAYTFKNIENFSKGYLYFKLLLKQDIYLNGATSADASYKVYAEIKVPAEVKDGDKIEADLTNATVTLKVLKGNDTTATEETATGINLSSAFGVNDNDNNGLYINATNILSIELNEDNLKSERLELDLYELFTDLKVHQFTDKKLYLFYGADKFVALKNAADANAIDNDDTAAGGSNDTMKLYVGATMSWYDELAGKTADLKMYPDGVSAKDLIDDTTGDDIWDTKNYQLKFEAKITDND